jgi:molybdopterin converting factor subunit 1
MNVRVLYFAVVGDLVGKDEEDVTLPDNVRDVRSFQVWIEARYAALVGRMASVRVARNEVFAKASDAIEEGDTLALLPPVAGG